MCIGIFILYFLKPIYSKCQLMLILPLAAETVVEVSGSKRSEEESIGYSTVIRILYL
jgi:hypothetical protein